MYARLSPFRVAIVLLAVVSPSVSSGQTESKEFFRQRFQFKKGEAEDRSYGYSKEWFERVVETDGHLMPAIGVQPIKSAAFDGPHDVAGRTRDILIDYSNQDRIFAASSGGGLWRSEDRALSWSPVNDNAKSLVVGCIAQSPLNPDILFHGTGEAHGSAYGIRGAGVFKSTDGGNTFVSLPSTEGNWMFSECWRIEFSKTEVDTVFVGTQSGGLMRTEDGGVTWEQVLDRTRVTDVITFSDGHVLAACSGVGIFYSPTGEPGSFLQVTDDSLPLNPGRIEIANCKGKPKHVYAAIERVTGKTSTVWTFYSKDGGRSWVRRSVASTGGTFDGYCLVLGVHPENEKKLVVGAVSLNYSLNGGRSWNRIEYLGQGHADKHAFANFDDDTSQFLIGNDGGVYEYDWSDLNRVAVPRNQGYNTLQCYHGDALSRQDVRIVGSQDNGSWRLGQPGTSMLEIPRAGDGGVCYISRQDPNYAYATSPLLGLSVTENFLETQPRWRNIEPSPEMAIEKFKFISPVAFNERDHRQIFAATKRGVWRTVNNGETWEDLSEPTTLNVTELLFVPRSNNLYAGGARGQFFRIENASDQVPGDQVDLRQSLPPSLRLDHLYCIKDVPSDPGTLLVAFSNHSGQPRIWKVTHADQDPQWRSISGNLPSQLPVNAVAEDPTHPKRVLFAGTDSGLFYTKDGGQTWSRESRVPYAVIYNLQVDAQERCLYVYTHGRGVWKLSLR